MLTELVLQVPPSNGAKVCEFRLEWGPQGGSLQVAYHGPSACWEMAELVPATEYCCRVQVREDLQYPASISSTVRDALSARLHSLPYFSKWWPTWLAWLSVRVGLV